MRNDISERSKSLPKTGLVDEPWQAFLPDPLCCYCDSKENEYSLVEKHQCHIEDRENIIFRFQLFAKDKNK